VVAYVVGSRMFGAVMAGMALLGSCRVLGLAWPAAAMTLGVIGVAAWGIGQRRAMADPADAAR
jgi:hypothetical protein